MKSQSSRVLLTVATLLLMLTPLFAQAEVVPFAEDFESLDRLSTTALHADWLVFATVFAPADTSYLYQYGTFPAPNDTLLSAFSQIVTGQGGVEQGLQQLVVLSDYENTDHGVGNLIEASVFHEVAIDTSDIGFICTFNFDAKRDTIGGNSTAGAFIKTINPADSYNQTNLIYVDLTNTPNTWQGYSLELAVTDSLLIGQLLQIGFTNFATNYEASSIIYDNINFTEVSELSDVPFGSVFAGAELRQNYPNPFNPSTRIDFSLEKSGPVMLTVYDIAGRHVATLEQGSLAAGDHHAVWDGRTDSGLPVATGRYNYVLQTAAGQTSRSMILLK